MERIVRTKDGYAVQISPKMWLNGYYTTELFAEKALEKHKAAYEAGKERIRKARHGEKEQS